MTIGIKILMFAETWRRDGATSSRLYCSTSQFVCQWLAVLIIFLVPGKPFFVHSLVRSCRTLSANQFTGIPFGSPQFSRNVVWSNVHVILAAQMKSCSFEYLYQLWSRISYYTKTWWMVVGGFFLTLRMLQRQWAPVSLKLHLRSIKCA